VRKGEVAFTGAIQVKRGSSKEVLDQTYVGYWKWYPLRTPWRDRRQHQGRIDQSKRKIPIL